MVLIAVLRNVSVGLTLSAALSSTALAQRVPGGDSGRYRAQAEAFRSEVRTALAAMLGRLSDQWDNTDPAKPSLFYAPNAAMVLGPDHLVLGRDGIRDEFRLRLGRMHGVQLIMDGFDLSGDLAFIRGTMKYDLTHGSAPSTKEIAVFTMALRPWRDVWLIESHTIGSVAVLPNP